MEIAVAARKGSKRKRPTLVHYLKSTTARTRNGSKSDPQQLRLYKMEREEIGARAYARLSLRTCKLVSRSVCRAYGVPLARIRRQVLPVVAAEWIHRPGQKYCTIVLNPSNGAATDLLTILHELAHHIHFYLAADVVQHQDHGPEFMACYISILDTVRFLPKDAMATVCDRRKLKYILPGPTVASLRKVLNQ